MKFALYVIILMCSTFSVSHAQQETHGGDGFVIEFFNIYSHLRSQLPEEDFSVANGKTFSVKSLDNVRPQMKVVSAPQVFWNGQEVSARNTPSKFLVELSQKHWLRLNYEQKISLVLHEVLPIAGWIDDDYTISTAILKRVDVKRAQLSLSTLADGLLSCSTSVLQNVSAGLYQSFLLETRTDFLQLAYMSTCEFYVQKAVEFSSLSEVRTTCDPDRAETPFEALLAAALSASPRGVESALKIYDLLYSRPEDQNLTCRFGETVKLKGTVCGVLRNYRNRSSEVLKAFAEKAGCR